MPPNIECGTGANIDEYSKTDGVLFNDTFVNVFTPPTSTTASVALTNDGNFSGFVPTTESVRLSALNPPTPYQNEPTAGVFDRWVTGPGGTIGTNSQDLDVNKQASDYALALYHAPCPVGYSWNPSSTISQCTPNQKCPIPSWTYVPALKECRCVGMIDPTTRACEPCPDGYGMIDGYCRCVKIKNQCV